MTHKVLSIRKKIWIYNTHSLFAYTTVVTSFWFEIIELYLSESKISLCIEYSRKVYNWSQFSILGGEWFLADKMRVFFSKKSMRHNLYENFRWGKDFLLTNIKNNIYEHLLAKQVYKNLSFSKLFLTDILPVCFVSYELDYQILDFLIYLTQKIVKKSNLLLILTISLK